jgi:serine protease Do
MKKTKFLLLFVMAASMLFADNVNTDPAFKSAIDIQNTFRKIAKDIIPKVVRIEKTGNSNQGNSLGSGIIVEQNGNDVFVLTNNHVLANASEINIITSDDKQFKGEIVGLDERSDVGVVKFTSTETFKTVKIGKSSDVQVGDWIIAVGNPYGFNGSMSVGIVSALGRAMLNTTANATDFIQTDAAINPGNSGGPLVNINGEVVAMTSWIASPTGTNSGLSFAIPIDNAVIIYSKIKKNKVVDYAWLGVGIYSLTDPTFRKSIGSTREHGAYINSIIKDSPADKTDLKVGDVIIAINDVEIKDDYELIWAISKFNPGDKIKVTYISGDKTKDIFITLGRRPGNNEVVQTSPQNTKEGGFLGAYFSNIDKDTAGKIGLKSNEGVIITRFDTVSAARDYALQKGDVVKKINTTTIKSLDDLDAFIKASSKDNVKYYSFYVIRDGRDLIVGVQK